jgi:hypothetical protein
MIIDKKKIIPSQIIKNQPIYFLLNTYAYLGLLSESENYPRHSFKKEFFFSLNSRNKKGLELIPPGWTLVGMKTACSLH